MDSVTLLCKAAALTLAVAGNFSGNIRPTVWAATGDRPAQVNVFYDRDAQQAAHRWQAAHWAAFDLTVLTSDGGVTLDGAYQRALLLHTRVGATGVNDVQYAIPYSAAGTDVEILPIIVMQHGGCTYLASDIAARMADGLRREVATYGMASLSFALPSAAEERACNAPQLVFTGGLPVI